MYPLNSSLNLKAQQVEVYSRQDTTFRVKNAIYDVLYSRNENAERSDGFQQ